MEDTTQYAQTVLEVGDVWNPKEKKRTTARRSKGCLENPSVDRVEWGEPSVRPTSACQYATHCTEKEIKRTGR